MNTNINDHTEEGAPEMVVKTEAEMQEGVDGGYWAPQSARNRVWEGVEAGSIRTCCVRLSEGVEPMNLTKNVTIGHASWSRNPDFTNLS